MNNWAPVFGENAKTFLLASSSKGERFPFAVNVRDIIVYIYKVGPLPDITWVYNSNN